MGIEMKVYHCSNPEENPLPTWMKKPEEKLVDYETYEQEQVRKFKESPDSFFPAFYSAKQAKRR